jgi:hypothetical protein
MLGTLPPINRAAAKTSGHDFSRAKNVATGLRLQPLRFMFLPSFEISNFQFEIAHPARALCVFVPLASGRRL